MIFVQLGGPEVETLVLAVAVSESLYSLCSSKNFSQSLAFFCTIS